MRRNPRLRCNRSSHQCSPHLRTAEFVADAAEWIESCAEGFPNHIPRGIFTLPGSRRPLEFPVLLAAKDDGRHLGGKGGLEIDHTAFGRHYGSVELFSSANTSSTTSCISM